MSAALHLGAPDDLPRLEPMVAAYHAATGRPGDETRRREALEPLLSGSPLGAVYLIGPRRAPIGYVVVTFGWSIEHGGMEGRIAEFFIREGVRGRGVGTEVLGSLIPVLENAGIRAIHIEADGANARIERFFAKHRFRPREGARLMTRVAPGV